MPTTSSTMMARPARNAAKKISASTKSAPAAKKNARSATPKAMDAIEMLKTDHAEVKKMYKQYQRMVKQNAAAPEREALAMKICRALTVHALAEEEVFYPAARAAIGDVEIMDHADVEHASAKDMIAQIMEMAADESHYDAKVCVLCEYVEHHVEEEEGEIFPKVRKAKLDLAELGEQLNAAKQSASDGEAVSVAPKRSAKG